MPSCSTRSSASHSLRHVRSASSICNGSIIRNRLCSLMSRRGNWPSLPSKQSFLVSLRRCELCSWGQRPISDDLLLLIVEEAHCLMTVLYRMLSALIPTSQRRLFDDKCLEAVLASPCQPPPPIPVAAAAAERPYRPPAARRAASPPPAAAAPRRAVRVSCDASTQTFSTGEITVLNVYYDT